MWVRMGVLLSFILIMSTCVSRLVRRFLGIMQVNVLRSGWRRMEVVSVLHCTLPPSDRIKTHRVSCALQAKKQEEDGVVWWNLLCSTVVFSLRLYNIVFCFCSLLFSWCSIGKIGLSCNHSLLLLSLLKLVRGCT